MPTMHTADLHPAASPLGLPWLLAASALLGSGCLGCGSRGFPVSGAVSFDGQPVAEGTIVFEPADGRGPTAGGAVAAGRYEVFAATPGEKRVRIFATRSTGRTLPTDPVPDAPLVEEIEAYIPDIYNACTTLACSVAERGPTVCDFHLKSP
jgi:glycine/D-amino acid oxidase-like deaminating enzyme